MDEALVIEGLNVHYFTSEGVVKAINNLDLTLRRSEILGLVGESGSGKSVLTHAIGREVRVPGRIISGEVRYYGKDLLKLNRKELGEILGNDVCFTISDPRSALNPLLTVGQSIVNVIRTHQNLSKKEALERTISMLEAVGINDPRRRASSYPHELSGGMAQRVVVALALVNSPQVLVGDEPTFALDVTIQAQVLDMLRELVASRDLSTLLITRDLGIAANYCGRVGVLYAGQVVEIGPVLDMFRDPKHPYTVALMETVEEKSKAVGSPLLGFMPDLKNLPVGCHLSDVCPSATEECITIPPLLREVARDHYVRCHFKKGMRCRF